MNESLDRRSLLRLSGAAAVLAQVAPAAAARRKRDSPIRSCSALVTAPDGRLVLADWRTGALHRVDVPSAPARSAGRPYNVRALDTALQTALGGGGRVRATALALDRAGERAWVAAEVTAKDGSARVWLAGVDPEGRVELVDPATRLEKTLPLEGAPTTGTVWKDIPARSFLVTDMKFEGGELLVAGLSNADFRSTFRRIAYPFEGSGSVTGVEMYHTVHNQVETRAPVRAFSVVELDGERHVLAAYTCTPLVLFPLKGLGEERLRGKTVAELGYGNTPVSVVPFSLEHQGQRTAWVLIANRSKAADLVSVDALAAAGRQPGLSQPVQVPFQTTAGVPTVAAPITGPLALVDQGPFFLALRRDADSGQLQLVSYRKGAFFRLSDHVNEYDFPSYGYPEDDQFQQAFIRPYHRMMRADEGYPELAR